uniref:Carnitine O-acetyltransferase a n=1 Tax=Nothobranchius furzeri TaxID=105023 RepID=A0A8C6KS59_NOTFU
MAKTCGLVRLRHLVKPVSATRVSGRYLTHQRGLPCLPVPPLQQTCERYILALEPIVEADELTHTKELVQEFQKTGGIGEHLQKGLEKRAQSSENWLSQWWVQVAYLDFRMPVVVHSSPGLVLPRMDFTDKQGFSSQTPDLHQLSVQLQRICSASPEADTDRVGLLTTLHRDTWGRAYLKLISDKTNKESVTSIQRSIFALCLDGAMPRVSDDEYRSCAAVQMLHGGGSDWNSGNRWFDKTLQFIVGEDGTCGANYEHAPAEGPPIVALIDHVVEYTRKPEMVQSPASSLPPPLKLQFSVTPEIRKNIEEAERSMNRLAQDLDMKVTVFKHFGKNIPKANKMSPDAFIQVALQLAYYRMYRTCCATYESASLRMFRLGRTDTIRSASNSSASFVKAFDNPSKQNPEKVDLMERAVRAHRSYTAMAVSGQAIDRHLLGLKMQALEENLSVPAIFRDPAYAKALHYRLSTSQVPSKTDCVMCFGPVVPDGYGVCYNPMEDHINFAVSSFNTCEETRAADLARAVEEALLDMRRVLDQSPRSKL